MANEKKFTDEEMSKIKEFQQSYIDIQQSFGQLSIARLRLEQQLNSMDDAEETLSKKFIDTQDNEKKFIDKITKKYGDGTLNPETGTYIPNKSK
tara:strand:+ start:85 stop:366 length:282 start_codon:yes stop_codon:yes gene_type:complete